jgi:hypothetical protein
MYFDDFYVIDITDRVDLDATVSAVSGLTTRVSNAEGNISSQSDSITTLNNGLSTLNKTVSTKADATALSSLQNTVTQQGKDISSASGSITSLQSSLNTLKVQSNPWIDGTFETYDNNQQLGGSTAIVTTDFKSSGSKCLKVTRPANTSGNSDKTIGSYSVVRQSAKYRVEFWAMMPASEAPPSGWSVVVGLHSINKDGGNDWQGITFNEAGLGGRDQWVKFTGVVKVSRALPVAMYGFLLVVRVAPTHLDTRCTLMISSLPISLMLRMHRLRRMQTQQQSHRCRRRSAISMGK